MDKATTRRASVSLAAMRDSTASVMAGHTRSRTARAALTTLAVIALIVVPVVVHEAVHVAVALAAGVSPSDLTVGFVGMYPGVIVDEPFDGWRLSLFHYSGGLLSGAAMIYLYVRWYWAWSGDKTGFAEWWLGALILVVAGNELGNGIAEGGFNAEYLANREPASIITVAATLGGFVVHRMLLGSRGARLAVLRGETGDRNEIEERIASQSRRRS